MGGIAVLSSKGQITIPKEIRDFLSLEQEDKLVFTAVSKNLLMVKPLNKNFLDFGGSVKARKIPQDFSQIRKQTMIKLAKSIVNKGSQ